MNLLTKSVFLASEEHQEILNAKNEDGLRSTSSFRLWTQNCEKILAARDRRQEHVSTVLYKLLRPQAQAESQIDF